MLEKIETKQLLKTDLESAWDFMSDPRNLAQITPEYMQFKVLGDLDGLMHAGKIIEYHVSPIAGIKMHWVTEITHVQDKVFFVDEQRFGPYQFWHHNSGCPGLVHDCLQPISAITASEYLSFFLW